MRRNIFFNFFICFLLSIIITFVCDAQTYTGSLILTTQADVDAFHYTNVTGNIGIVESTSGNITNLNGLSGLVSVEGELDIIRNSALVNLSGLQDLTTIGGELNIYHNDALINIDGLSHLTSVKDINIGNNAALTNIDGLLNITSVDSCVAIYWNKSLANYNGLSNLTSVGVDLAIQDNDSPNIDALSNLTFVGRDLGIAYCKVLENVDGLRGLTSVGGTLGIESNTALTNIDGLSNIATIGNGLLIAENTKLANIDGLSSLSAVNYIQIWANPLLTNINALSGIKSLSGTLFITQNDSLWNIDGLSNLSSLDGDLDITNNIGLSKFCGLYKLLSTGGLSGAYNVYGNAANPTEEDIINGGPCYVQDIPHIVSEINNLETEGTLNSGQANSLTDKLEQALNKLNDGNKEVAVRKLNAFINQVESLISEGVLTEEEGQALIDEANNIISQTSALSKIAIKNNKTAKNKNLPKNFHLEQNYPNPFNPSTVIRYDVPKEAFVTVKIYDVLGRLVKTLVNEQKPAGRYDITFNAKNLSSGIYLYRIQAGDFIQTKKMMLLK